MDPFGLALMSAETAGTNGMFVAVSASKSIAWMSHLVRVNHFLSRYGSLLAKDSIDFRLLLCED